MTNAAAMTAMLPARRHGVEFVRGSGKFVGGEITLPSWDPKSD